MSKPMKRCDRGHFYDESEFSSCPYCGVDFNQESGREVSPQNRLEDDEPLTAPHREPKAGGMDQVTVPLRPEGYVQGFDPVVGWLVCIEGAERGRDYRIRSERNFIGRGDQNSISIKGDESISRNKHAIINFVTRKCQFWLQPGDDVRGNTYRNGEPVLSPQRLEARDIIEIGDTKLIFIPFCGESFEWHKETEWHKQPRVEERKPKEYERRSPDDDREHSEGNDTRVR